MRRFTFNTYNGYPIESICIAFFSVEFVGRFISCPTKCSFLKEIGNLIDILAIIPYYFSIGVEVLFMHVNDDANQNVSETSEKVAFLALLRVIRILRQSDTYIAYIYWTIWNKKLKNLPV